jgi:hypothetical protein
MVMVGCATSRTAGTSTITLNFKNCGPDLSYKKMKLSIPKGYEKKKVLNDAFCEYRFTYPNGAILYVSSNIYYGSALNYENRLSAGIKTYSVDRSLNENIKNSGREDDDQYWMESIKNEYVTGYVNYPDSIDIATIFQNLILVD